MPENTTWNAGSLLTTTASGDSIFYTKCPQRTVEFNPTKKTRKPRKKQERIKTIKDQMKDIP